MNNYIISSSKDTKKIVSINIEDSYSFNLRAGKGKIVNIKQITMYDKDAIANILNKKCSTRIKKLVKLIKDVCDDEDATDDDFTNCIDEISKIRNILYYNYQKYLRKVDYENFMNELMFADNYLKGRYLSAKNVIGGNRR